ncbi:MAG: hypothetical protein ACI4AA_10230 [Lachnospiraceae bacterium]
MKRKLLQTVLCFTLAAILLCGCGNEKNESATEEVQESATEEDVTEELEKEEQEAQQPDEEEISADMPEAKVTTTVENFDGLVAYIQSLDTNAPHIVIYNEAEGYIIDMKEGEHYQLKKDDRIFLNVSSNMKTVSYSIPEMKYESIAGGGEIIPNYSEFSSPQEAIYGILLEEATNDEKIYLICYLDAPTE